MSKILLPLAQGFEEIEAVNIIDVLRRAEIEVVVASLTEIKAVKGANDIVVLSDISITQLDSKSFDMIILPGGVEGTNNLVEDENVQRMLKEMDKDGKNIGAICAAPVALNKAGVLKQKYTCYPSFEKYIKADGFMGDKAMVVEDENIITSRGPATAICFALAIVKKLKGEEMYNALKVGLLADFCE